MVGLHENSAEHTGCPPEEGRGHRRGKGQPLVAQLMMEKVACHCSSRELFIAMSLLALVTIIIRQGHWPDRRLVNLLFGVCRREPVLLFGVSPGTGIVVWSVAGEPASIVAHGGQPRRCQPTAGL